MKAAKNASWFCGCGRSETLVHPKMKTTIFAALTGAVVLLALPGCGPAKRVPPTIHNSGKIADLEAQFDDLMNGTPTRGSMVVELTGSGDFIQFDYGKGTLGIDFPVFTDRQKELEPVSTLR